MLNRMGQRQPVKKIRKPGIAQTRLLEPMSRNNGTWPTTWALKWSQSRTMDDLITLGLVTKADGVYSLTATGWAALARRPIPTTPKVDRRRKDWSAR